MSAPIAAASHESAHDGAEPNRLWSAERIRSTNRRCKATTMLRMLPLVANEVYGV